MRNLRPISSAARQKLIKSAWEKAKAQAEIEMEARRQPRDYELRGNNLAVQTMTDEEILLVGAAGTGKTLAVLKKLNDIAWAYPGARIGIIRKVRADLAQTTLVTFERDILGLNNPICKGVLRENRMSYRYPNGSEIVVGGMDRPGKVLSGEYHVFYVAEAVEITENDWEFLLMRLGRDGLVPFAQLIADTNPSHPNHWLKLRCDSGQCKLLNTFHHDNPAYWDAAAGEWTERGRKYVLGKLGRLTSVRRARFLEGRWVVADGSVYEEFADHTHVIDPFPIPAHWRRFRSIDFGYTNPFVCQWWAMDGDGRMYLYREIYRTQRTVADHAQQILQLSAGENIEFTVADHDAEDRATLQRVGINTIAAKKAISTGIQKVQERLRTAGDGKPRLFILRGALHELDTELVDPDSPERHPVPISTLEEFPAYVWPKGDDGRTKKETPVDANNHGMDAMRYMIMAVDNASVTGGFATGRAAGLYGRKGRR